MQYERRTNWAPVWLVGIVLAFVCVAVWWLQEQFGATIAIVVIGSVLGVVCVLAGAALIMVNTRSTLENAAQFNANIANTEKARQMTTRESVRLERDVFNRRARLEEIDARRVDQLAQQRAKLLTDVQRQQMELQYRALEQQISDEWRRPLLDDEAPGHREEW